MLDKKQQLCVVSGERNSEILLRALLPKPTRQGSDGGTSGRVDGILSGQAGFESQVGIFFFSVQVCYQSILTGCQAFSNNV